MHLSSTPSSEGEKEALPAAGPGRGLGRGLPLRLGLELELQSEGETLSSPLAPVSPCSPTTEQSIDFLFASDPISPAALNSAGIGAKGLPSSHHTGLTQDSSLVNRGGGHLPRSFENEIRHGKAEDDDAASLGTMATLLAKDPRGPGSTSTSSPSVSLSESAQVKKWRLAAAATAATGRSPLDGVPLEFLSNLSVYRDELRQVDRELQWDHSALNGRAFDRLLGLLEQDSDKSVSSHKILGDRRIADPIIPEPPPVVQRSMPSSIFKGSSGPQPKQHTSDHSANYSYRSSTTSHSTPSLIESTRGGNIRAVDARYRGPFFPDLSQSCDAALERSVDVSQRVDQSVNRVDAWTERLERDQDSTHAPASAGTLNSSKMLAPNWTLQLHLKRTLAMADELLGTNAVDMSRIMDGTVICDTERRGSATVPSTVCRNAPDEMDTSVFTYSPIPGPQLERAVDPRSKLLDRTRPSDEVSLIFASSVDATKTLAHKSVDNISRRWLDSTTVRDERAQVSKDVAARLDASLNMLGSAVGPLSRRDIPINNSTAFEVRSNKNQQAPPNRKPLDADQISEIICAAIMSTAGPMQTPNMRRADTTINSNMSRNNQRRSRSPEVIDSDSEESEDDDSRFDAAERVYNKYSHRFDGTERENKGYECNIRKKEDVKFGEGRILTLFDGSFATHPEDRRFDDVMSSYRSLAIATAKAKPKPNNNPVRSIASIGSVDLSSIARERECHFHLFDQCGDDVEKLIELGRQAVRHDRETSGALRNAMDASRQIMEEDKLKAASLNIPMEAADLASIRATAIPRASRLIDNELTLSPFKGLSVSISLPGESNAISPQMPPKRADSVKSLKSESFEQSKSGISPPSRAKAKHAVAFGRTLALANNSNEAVASGRRSPYNNEDTTRNLSPSRRGRHSSDPRSRGSGLRDEVDPKAQQRLSQDLLEGHLAAKITSEPKRC